MITNLKWYLQLRVFLVKGLYELARKGVIKEFTGISDPYEVPKNAEIVVNSSGTPPEELVDQIYIRIREIGYIK